MVDPLRIAYASPLPPTRSGIADYSAELLPPLAARARVALFAPEPGAAVASLPVAPLEALPDRRWAFDLILYHMGNSAHHAAIYRMALRYPGVVVLHDLYLHHFIAHTTAGQGDHAAYARELAYALGEDGRPLLEDIRAGRRPTPLAEVSLNDRLLDTSLAIIVHSEFAREHVLRHNPAATVAVIPQLIAPHPATSRRGELGLPEDAVLFGSVGQVTAARGLPRVLAALRRLRDEGIDARFLVAGEVLPEAGLEQAIAELGLESYVIQVGYVPTLEAFVDWTATLDVVLNLRYPTLGETSASALRAMAAGRPIVVLDHGWYRELPDDAAVKLPAAPDPPGLADVLRALAQDPARRTALGRAASAYVDSVARPDAVAQAYVDFLTDLRAGWRHG
jgi:glycosyltransferase involved in cell wall biosynthesis